MEKTVLDSGIAKFISLINTEAESIDEMTKQIGYAAAETAGELKLGKLTCETTAEKSRGSELLTAVYESAEGFEEYRLSCDYDTGESGRVSFVFCPAKGISWTEDEQETIKLIGKLCYILIGKTRLQELVSRSAFVDPMTGAANTAGLMRFGEKLSSTGALKDYAAVHMNIKHFKYINQVYGSASGDRLLLDFSKAMEGFVGGDGVFATLGGDNFVLLIRKGMIVSLRSFTNALSFELGEGDARQLFDIRLRIGIAEAEENDTMNDLMCKASVALSACKLDERKDVVYFVPKLLEDSLHEKQVSMQFPTALKNREFVIYYQPKVNLSDKKLCGCEALSRWVRNGEIVPPADFIPVLEREGSVCQLDFYVLETVCADISRWIDMGLTPVRVSTNFSRVHLHNKRLAEQILGIIKKYGIDPKYIEVELTEMTGYDDYGSLGSFVEKMKKYGISTSIDDFGSGYSSLNMLKNLDVDVVKMDKSFFTNITDNTITDASDKVVVKNIVNMVNELHMEVISEGVETAEQAEFLKNIDCSVAQGFLFDMPLPCEEFEKRLRTEDFYSDRT